MIRPKLFEPVFIIILLGKKEKTEEKTDEDLSAPDNFPEGERTVPSSDEDDEVPF